MSSSSFDASHYMSLPDDEAEAYLAEAKGGPDGEEGGEDDDSSENEDAAAQPEAQDPTAGAEQGQEEGQDGRVTMVRHEALHEARMREREAKVRAAELEQELNALRAQQAAPSATPNQPAMPAETPGLLFEDPEAIAGFVGPLVQKALNESPEMQELRQLREEKAENQALQAIANQYQDPEAAALMAEFDAAVPAYKQAGLPLEARYMMARGVRAASPQAKAQAAADAQAAGRQMTVEQKAREMAAKAQNPHATPTLAGIPPAAANGPDADMSRISAKDMLAMPQDKLDSLRRGGAVR
jgi:hypothetical protein